MILNDEPSEFSFNGNANSAIEVPRKQNTTEEQKSSVLKKIEAPVVE